MSVDFDAFFQGPAKAFLNAAIGQALAEDGHDLAAAMFLSTHRVEARLVSKQRTVVAGLPVIPHIFRQMMCYGAITTFQAQEGSLVEIGTSLAKIVAPAISMLRAERIFLNFICHMSGIADLTRRYVEAMGQSHTRLLDTRKTLPGLRYPEKYAVRVGGGHNHRFNLNEMVIIKDNYIDAFGSIRPAVDKLRSSLGSACPELEIECRTLNEVREAVKCRPKRIMLDNMPVEQLALALNMIPEGIESEISGGVNLDNIGAIAALNPDFISVGAIIHSASYADLSLQFALAEQ